MNYSLKRPRLSDRVVDFDNFVKMQELIEMVANCEFDQNFYVQRSGRRMRIGLYLESGDTYHFQCKQHGATQAIVTTGDIFFGTNAVITIAETTVTFSGTTEYVYVKFPKNGVPTSYTPASIERASAVPTSGDDYYRWTLAIFTASTISATKTWKLNAICWRGDIHLALPLVSP